MPETDTAENLFDGVNASQFTMLLGSTEKMGADTNVQRRLGWRLHPGRTTWRPRDIEQREGRILRQGTFDKGFESTAMSPKAPLMHICGSAWRRRRFIHQVMRGETSVRAAEDLDGALTYAEIKAIASGNPAVVEKIRIVLHESVNSTSSPCRSWLPNQQRHIR